MKTLNDYMAMSYRMEIVEDKDEGGFVVSYPDLPGCITCGETVESAVANALDAKKAWIEAALEEGVEIHEPDSLEDYSGQFKLRIPRSLHRSLAEHSQREGISMNQYCVYLLSRNDAFFSMILLPTRSTPFTISWQQIGNRKSVSQNNICNRNKIPAKKIRNLNKYI